MVHPQPFLVFLGFFLLLLRFTANLIFFSPPQVAGSFTQTEQMITWLYWMSVKCLMTQVSTSFQSFLSVAERLLMQNYSKPFFSIQSSYEDVKVFPTIETLDEKQAKYLGGADTRLDERSITRDERTVCYSSYLVWFSVCFFKCSHFNVKTLVGHHQHHCYYYRYYHCLSTPPYHHYHSHCLLYHQWLRQWTPVSEKCPNGFLSPFTYSCCISFWPAKRAWCSKSWRTFVTGCNFVGFFPRRIKDIFTWLKMNGSVFCIYSAWGFPLSSFLLFSLQHILFLFFGT